jgi:glycosyl hydrolase family 26
MPRARLAALVAFALLATLAGPIGSTPAVAAAFTFSASADAQVSAASPGTNYGRTKSLGVGSSPVVESYVRFDVRNVTGSVQRAKLRLWDTDATVDGPAVYPSATGWQEKKVNWSTRPARTGPVLQDLGNVPGGAWAEFDVTGAVRGNGTFSFALVATSADAAAFSSREQRGFGPQLVVETFIDTTPPETTIDSGPVGDVPSTTALFAFSSSESGSFQCRLDAAAYAACASPKSYTGLAAGPHTFSVRAVDTAGNVDPTPASRTWRVVTGGGSPRDALLAPATGALWGAHHKVDNAAPIEDKKAAIQSFEAAVGRTLGVDMYYEPWGNVFPDWREQWDFSQGRIPMISWGKTTTTDITSGMHDTYIRARADGIKALGQPIFLRWFWEMDGTKNAGLAVSPSAYIAAWRHLRGIFAERGVTNVAWVWCPNASAFRDGSAQPFYPGDDVVDWVCADGYNWYPDSGRSYESFTDKFTAFHDWAVAQGKPAIVGEYGAQQMEPGRRAGWFNEARDSLKTRLTGILGVVYFHSVTSEHDWQVTNEADALAAFAAMGADPFFNP